MLVRNGHEQMSLFTSPTPLSFVSMGNSKGDYELQDALALGRWFLGELLPRYTQSLLWSFFECYCWGIVLLSYSLSHRITGS